MIYFLLGCTKLMLCFMDYLPLQGDPAGWEKIKVYHEINGIIEITMIAKYLEDIYNISS